jgi:ribosomal protein S27E
LGFAINRLLTQLGAAMSRKIKFSCAFCGKDVWKYASKAGHFCSLACYHQSRAQTLVMKQCSVCQTEFEGVGSQKYCSDTCKRKRDHEAEKRNLEIECPRCGQKRTVFRSPHAAKNTHCRTCTGLIAREKSTKRGSESAQWKGGRRVDGYGYIKLHSLGHPFADSTNYVREHLVVVTEHFGETYVRQRGNVVHHINGDKQDNRLENLYVCTAAENKAFNAELMKLAFELVKVGIIEFDRESGTYRCPLLGDE